MYGSSLADSPEHRERLRALVLARYGAPLYVPSASGAVVVRVWAVGGSLHVLDAPMHELLARRLKDELGASSTDLVLGDASAPRYAEAWARVTDAELLETFSFDVDAAGQLARYERFRAGVRAYLAGLFPVRAGDRSLVLGEVEMAEPLPPPDSSRCPIYAVLTLEVGGVRVDVRRVGVCNIFAPRADGRIDDMRGVGRPFDEVLAGFERSIPLYLGKDLPATLARTPSKDLKVAALFRG